MLALLSGSCVTLSECLNVASSAGEPSRPSLSRPAQGHSEVWPAKGAWKTGCALLLTALCWVALNGKTSHFCSPLSLQSGSTSPTPLDLSHPGSVQGLPWPPHCTNEATEAQRGRCLTQGYKARQVAGWGPSRAFLLPSPHLS